MNDIPQQKTTRSRLTLIILVLVFVLPIALAWLVAKNKSWQPDNTKNYGELYEPVRPLPDFKLTLMDGKAFTLEDMRQKWSFIYFVSTQCDAACQDSLVKIRDVRLAQSGEALRVQYFLIFTAPPDQAELKQLVDAHPKLTLLTTEAGNASAMLGAFRHGLDVQLEQAQRVYLVDPAGNLMMFYPKGFYGNGLLKDIRHLLKWSQIG